MSVVRFTFTEHWLCNLSSTTIWLIISLAALGAYVKRTLPDWNASVSIFDSAGPTKEDFNATYSWPPSPGDYRVQNWAVIGDSFSAGPGACCRVPKTIRNCYNNDRAYGPLLSTSQTFTGSAYDDPAFFFGACSGDLIADVSVTSETQRSKTDATASSTQLKRPPPS